MEDIKPKRKRGRPQKDYSLLIGHEGPMGLKILSILEPDTRAREGPHVDALCPLCGEHSKPRLRDVVRGHSRWGGCRKRQCFLEYCDRVVARMDEAKRAGVWVSRYTGVSRKATASKLGLAFPIVDAALRAYQAKLDKMVADGTALRVFRLALVPGHGNVGLKTAAESFRLPVEVVQYLLSKAINRVKAAKKATPDAINLVDSAVCKAGYILECVALNRSDELTREELRQKRNGELCGSLVMQYLECKGVDPYLLNHKQAEIVEAAIEICENTLANRRQRYEAGRDRAIRNKQLQTEARAEECYLT